MYIMCLGFSLHQRSFTSSSLAFIGNFYILKTHAGLYILAGIKSLHIFSKYSTEISRIYGISAVHFQLCNTLNQELIAVSDSDKLLLNTSLILLSVEGNSVQPLFYFH